MRSRRTDSRCARWGPTPTSSCARRRAAPVADPDAPMDEVSVYASRYAIDGGLAEPREMSPNDIERVPGSHDDALRALHSLPGIASNASARPYIRGSLSEDVLVRYDGIPLLDPFHLKNFQSLISAIDPAGIEQHRSIQRRFSGAVRHALGRSDRRHGAVVRGGSRISRQRQPDFRRRFVDRQSRALAGRVAGRDPAQRARLDRSGGRWTSANRSSATRWDDCAG